MSDIWAPMGKDRVIDTRTPFSDSAVVDDPLVAMVERQAAWVAAVTDDPQDWLFAQRARLQSQGSCNPWAEQLLYRAGMLPAGR